MKLKYIMYEVDYADGLKKRIPIFFPEPVVHACMHEALEMGTEVMPGPKGTQGKLVSAGFVDSDALLPYGESESLKMLNLPCIPLRDDYKVLATYDYAHGIV